MRRPGLFVTVLLACLGPADAHAQTYPDKPIKLVIPFVPGSPVDVLGRVVSQQLGARLGQSVVVDNRPGGGTSTATKAVVAAPADGYTLLMSGQTLAYLGLFYPDLGFDPMKAFAPVATLAGWSHVLVVTPSVPARTLAELVAHAKANPGKLTLGFGLGTSPQILGEYLKVVAGLDLVSVPYRGGEQVRIDLLGGRIHVNFAPVSNVLAMIREARSSLAVTARRATPTCPMFRPLTEQAIQQVGFHPDVWQAFVAPPRATPFSRDQQAQRGGQRNAQINGGEANLDRLGFDPMIMSPQEFAAFLATQAQKWPSVIKAANIQPQ
jgi:tripartite-type tricarboxylate transporter receptor subunit TctC